MSSSKGVESFAEDFIAGAIGFAYSSATTIAIVLLRPIRGPVGFRALRNPRIKPLSAPVAMFLSYLAIVKFDIPFLTSGSPDLKSYVELINLSGLPWYSKLIASSVLFVLSDLFIRLAGLLFSTNKRRYYRDCDRLRYAVAGSAVVLMFSLELFTLAEVFSDYDSELSLLGDAVLYFGTCYPLVIVLGSIIRDRFHARRFVTISLAYICSVLLIWIGAGITFAAGLGAYGELDSAVQSQPPPPPPPEVRKVRVSKLLCLIQPDGRLTVSALFQNDSNTVCQ